MLNFTFFLDLLSMTFGMFLKFLTLKHDFFILLYSCPAWQLAGIKSHYIFVISLINMGFSYMQRFSCVGGTLYGRFNLVYTSLRV